MSSLPYVTAPGSIERALNGIRSAQTPDRVTQDFVKTILKIPGGSGTQITSFLKKVGFVNSDGTPSDLYNKFRNKSTAGAAAAEALKIGYANLYKRNEYMHKLDDSELKGLIIEETGQSAESNVPGLIVSAINAVKKFATYGKPPVGGPPEPASAGAVVTHIPKPPIKSLGMNLSYTINLNLPATSDIAVFNAIFKSLRENLLRDTE